MVCKLKFGKLLDNKKDFRSKNFFGAEPRALKVEWVVGSKFRNLKILLFFTLTSNFGHKRWISVRVSSPSTYNRLSVLICKRNEVNWAKNDRVRAVFVAEVKIPENEQF